MPEEPEIASGVLLIADPTLKDPNFRRRVVLLCEHNREGSLGLVLNRATDVTLQELLDELGGFDREIFLGGPVQPNMLNVLHRHGEIVEEGREVIEGISWGGGVETIQELLTSGHGESDDVRFFLGYAGWAPGQLEDEIEQGGWILTRAPADLLFELEPDQLWRELLRRMGGDYAVLANYPEDPRMN